MQFSVCFGRYYSFHWFGGEIETFFFSYFRWMGQNWLFLIFMQLAVILAKILTLKDI